MTGKRGLRTVLAMITVLVAAGCGSSSSGSSGVSTKKSGTPPTPIVSVPAQVAQTAAGPVGYRSDGKGTPLLLIMGYSGSMDYWQPSFVNALAQHYRVITIDNAGVGQTGGLSAPLSVTAMTDQTAAFINAEKLGAVDVLAAGPGRSARGCCPA